MKKSAKYVTGLSCASLIFLSGCAMSGASYRPIIDAKGVDLNRYEADLADCQGYARQAPSAGKSALSAAAAGGAIGLAGSAISGGNEGKAAGLGALIGGILGASSGATDRQDIIQKCITGRGYKVLK